MEHSLKTVSMQSEGDTNQPTNERRFPFGRVLVAGLVCGSLYGFLYLLVPRELSTWLMYAVVTAGIFLPVLWIFAKELRLYGLGGISIERLILALVGFVVVSAISFLAFVVLVVTVWL